MRNITAPPPFWLAIAIALAIAFAAAVLAPPADASGGYTDEQVSEALTFASNRFGVSRELLRAVSWCESNWNPSAVGDHGRSHGLFQLNDRSTGLLWHFYEVGYTNAYSPYQSANYFAGVVAGKYPGVSPSRWSCYRIVTR